MSSYHRRNPEKGNQVEPPPSALPLKEDSFRWPGSLCPEHPEEHAKARDAVYRDQQGHGLSASNAMAVSRSISCPVCYLDKVDKAYDRKARLAENAEAMFEDLRWCVGLLRREGYDAAADRITEYLNKIEPTPEEGK